MYINKRFSDVRKRWPQAYDGSMLSELFGVNRNSQIDNSVEIRDREK